MLNLILPVTDLPSPFLVLRIDVNALLAACFGFVPEKRPLAVSPSTILKYLTLEPSTSSLAGLAALGFLVTVAVRFPPFWVSFLAGLAPLDLVDFLVVFGGVASTFAGAGA